MDIHKLCVALSNFVSLFSLSLSTSMSRGFL